MKKLLLALLSVLVVLLVLERTWDFLIKENKNIKLSHAVKGGIDVPILFHGPCEPLFTISPSYLDSLTGIKSYNYALRHTDFADNYLHLYLYLKHNKAPQKLFLYVTPESFDLRFNTFHTFRFATWLNDTVVSKTIKEMDPDYFQYSWFPFAKYAYYNTYKTFDAIQGFKNWMSSDETPYFEDGHVPHENTNYTREDDGFIAPKQLSYADGNTVEELENGKTYYEIYDSNEVFTWNKTREKYFRKIIEISQSAGIEIVLYESTPYWGSIVGQKNRQEFLTKTKNIANEFGIQYLIYDSLAIGKSKENFVCPLILGEAAGKIFMQNLAEQIRE